MEKFIVFNENVKVRADWITPCVSSSFGKKAVNGFDSCCGKFFELLFVLFYKIHLALGEKEKTSLIC